MAYLTKEQLLKVQSKRDFVPVQLDGLDGEILIWEMSGSQASRLADLVMAYDKQEGRAVTEILRYKVKSIICSMCDENGSPVFEGEVGEVDSMQDRLSVTDINKLFEAVMEMNPQTRVGEAVKKAVEDAEKKDKKPAKKTKAKKAKVKPKGKAKTKAKRKQPVKSKN